MTKKHAKPFSVHQKKKQLQEKRQKKRQNKDEYDWGSYTKDEKTIEQEKPAKTFDKKNIVSTITDGNSKLRTIFEKEPRSAIDQRIKDSRIPLTRLLHNEQDNEDIIQRQLTDHIYTAIDMPLRPKWNYSMSRREVEQQEEKYFDQYLHQIYEKYSRDTLNYFEHNLNVWRQLWRTLEISDILLLVADVRHPLFHFPQSLYHYVTHGLNKPLILLLNKCDLVPLSFQQMWVQWFQKNYPKLKVVTFSSYKTTENDPNHKSSSEKTKLRFKRKIKLVDRDLVHKIWQTCSQIQITSHIDYEQQKQYWQELMEKREEAIIAEQLDPEERRVQEKLKKRRERKLKKQQQQQQQQQDDHDENDDDDNSVYDHVTVKTDQEKKKVKDFLTVGLIGHPNTGKSCVLNGLVGKTVVSASYTPGHTKHFQTFFVSKHVRLCDSPGLVFPAVDMPRPLQVLCGLFPIAQSREPYSAIRYLAERVPIEKIYKLYTLPESQDTWSAWSLCEAYAIKRQYFTPKRARPDVYRAANEILRDVLYGRVLLCFTPPDNDMNGLQSLITSQVKVLDKESVKEMMQDNKNDDNISVPNDDDNDNDDDDDNDNDDSDDKDDDNDDKDDDNDDKDDDKDDDNDVNSTNIDDNESQHEIETINENIHFNPYDVLDDTTE